MNKQLIIEAIENPNAQILINSDPRLGERVIFSWNELVDLLLKSEDGYNFFEIESYLIDDVREVIL